MAGSKRFQDLNLKDNFLFVNVLSDKEICKQVLEKILNVKISRIEEPEGEKTVDFCYDRKGVRFDIYVKGRSHALTDADTVHSKNEDDTAAIGTNEDDGEETVYEIEMQTSTESDIGARAHYYQSMIASQELKKGARYSELPNSYVIFICTFTSLIYPQ